MINKIFPSHISHFSWKKHLYRALIDTSLTYADEATLYIQDTCYQFRKGCWEILATPARSQKCRKACWVIHATETKPKSRLSLHSRVMSNECRSSNECLYMYCSVLETRLPFSKHFLLDFTASTWSLFNIFTIMNLRNGLFFKLYNILSVRVLSGIKHSGIALCLYTL